MTNTLSNHALLWNGTAASAVDLHPAGFDSSAAFGVAGGMQVGEGSVSLSGLTRALRWSGSAGSVLDLHSFLPPGFAQSTARGLDAATGNIIGVAFQTNSDVNGVAVMWTPITVPEPSAWTLMGAGLGAALMRSRRRGELD